MPKIIATKEDWLKLGYQLFSEQGISGIVVEQMSKKLKVNKSSFYWHFKSKKDYVDAIVTYWTTTSTNQIIELVESQKTPKKRFQKLVELAFGKDDFLDFIFFLKRYARKHKPIQFIIDEIDHQRIQYVKNILIEMNFSVAEAEIKSQLFYKYLIGYHEMIRFKKQSKNYKEQVKKEINQFIQY